MNKSMFALNINNETELNVLATTLAQAIQQQKGNGLTFFLNGNLGAGKTTFTRYLLKGFGHFDKVKSPTYTLVECYQLDTLNVYHFDFYRFSDPEEWELGGFRDYFVSPNICVVEWAEQLGSYCPPADLIMDIEFIEHHINQRKIVLTANTQLGEILIEQVKKSYDASI